MIDIQEKKCYSEVYSVINMLGNKYIEKTPKKLYQLIDSERDKTYNPTYNANLPIATQAIADQSLAIIMLIHLNYWCENEQEKAQLKKILSKNQAEVEEKYSIENIFEQRKKVEEQKNEIRNQKQNSEEVNNTSLVEYKENFIQKIRKAIYNLFHRNKK